MTQYNLFLDDVRRPEQAHVPGVRRKDIGLIIPVSLLEVSNTSAADWVVVRNYDDFAMMLRNGDMPVMVSFDHDLHREHMEYFFKETVLTGVIEYGNLKNKTGYHCAQLLVKTCKDRGCPLPICYIHSANEYGAANIKKELGI